MWYYGNNWTNDKLNETFIIKDVYILRRENKEIKEEFKIFYKFIQNRLI